MGDQRAQRKTFLTYFQLEMLVRHAIGHAVLALLSHHRSRITEASASQEKDTHVLSPASLEGVHCVAMAGDTGA